MNQQTNPEAQAQPDATAPAQIQSEVQLKPIESIDQFFAILSAWHQQQIGTVQHFMTIPDGTEVAFDDTAAPLVLTGEALRGFRAGLSTALEYLEALPFTYTQTAIPEEPPLDTAQLELALTPAESTVQH